MGKSGDIPKLVDEWIRVKKSNDKKQLQGFINNALAEPWKQTIVKASDSGILKARCDLPPQIVPEEAVALTAGIDVQKDGFWFVVRAWAQDFTSWLVHYGLLSTWELVEGLLFDNAYPVEGDDERHMKIARAGIDTGGGKLEEGPSMTEQTYLWLLRSRGRGCVLWGTKGASSPMVNYIQVGKQLQKTPSGKAIAGIFRVLLLDTDKFKADFHQRLENAGEGIFPASYLHSEVEKTYLSHITAEERRVDQKGRAEWVQVKRENHLLDCEILSMAMAHWECPGGGVNLAPKPKSKLAGIKDLPKPPKRERWLPEKKNWFGR